MALAHAILACLVHSPCSGYDLAKQFDGSVGYFWSASHQQIYRELSKLEAQNWITAETITQAGRPDKKLYHVTDIGEEQLVAWIAEACEPMQIKDDLLVKMFAGYVVSPQILREEIERHRQVHVDKLSEYKDLEQRYFQNPPALLPKAKFQYLTLRRGILYETEWLAWCDEAIALLC